MAKSNKPIRAEGLDVHETEDGLIVFNPATDRVHHLNHTAGAVFELCDGSRDGGQVVEAVTELFSLDQSPVDIVETAIEELTDEGVLLTGREEAG